MRKVGRPLGPVVYTVDRQRRHPRFSVPAGIVAAALAAALIALVTSSRSAHSPGTTGATWTPPALTRTDLVAAYTFSGAGIRRPAQVWRGDLSRTGEHPFSGQLRLFPPSVQSAAPELPAARLWGPGFAASRVGRIAHQLGIHSRIVHVRGPNGSWVAVQQRGVPGALESVAVSLTTGEMIYHDALSSIPPSSRSVLGDARAYSIARTWAAMLGWPGMSMPREPLRGPEKPGLRTIALGWSGIGPSNTPAAIISMTADGRVVEADLWPPIAAIRSVVARGLSSAWSGLQGGKGAIVVEGMMGGFARHGSGVTTHANIVQILTSGSQGKLYLVPAYRFSGTVHTDGERRSRNWYGLVPAAA